MRKNMLFVTLITGIILMLVVGLIYQEKGFSFFKKDSKVSVNEPEENPEETSQPEKNNSFEESNDNKENNNNGTELTTIKNLRNKPLNSMVSVEGTVVQVQKHEKGHIFITLKENEETLLVPIFTDKNINASEIVEGVTLTVNGELEVIPKKQNDISIKKVEQKIVEADEGKNKLIKAKVMSVYNHPEGHVFLTVKILQTEQVIEVPIFSNLNPNEINVTRNATVEVEGKVSIYKNKLQLIPYSLENVSVLEEGEKEYISQTKIDSITENREGEKVVLSGLVSNVAERNGHLFFKLSNENDSIDAVLFKADSTEIEGRKQRIMNAEKAQFKLKVEATINVYKGNLQLVIDRVLVD